MVALSQMKALVMTSEKGSLAAAARELGVSTAAVSKQLILLEKELGLQLITRTTRHLEFTEVGKSYCDQCRRVLEELDMAAALVDQMKIVPQGQLKVLSSRYFGSVYILPYLHEFLSLFPNIHVDIELSERLPNFDEELLDISIGMSIPLTGHITQKQIETNRACFCASPSYLNKFGTPRVPKDLAKHRHIIHSMRSPPNILNFPNNETVSIKPYICINDSLAMIKLAQDGLGIIKTHYALVQELLENKTLVEVLPSFIETEVPLYVAFPQRRYVSPKVRNFIDFFLNKAKSKGI